MTSRRTRARFANDEEIDERVRLMFKAIDGINYTGEVMQVVYRFLFDYVVICHEGKTAKYVEMANLIDHCHEDLMEELRQMSEEEEEEESER